MPSDPVIAEREMTKLLRGGKTTTRDPRWFGYGDLVLAPHEIIELLDGYLTDRRRERIHEILENRTYSLAIVVEGMVDTGNVSAVMRTADGFGIQEFHAIDTASAYKNSKRTSQGTEKWLDRYRWRSPAECVADLHNRGYRVVAADIDEGARPINEIDFSKPTALAFGNEMDGLSPELLKLADDKAMIPISGFVQSFNISVAAAVCLYQARLDRERRLGHHGDLSGDDRERLRAVFTIKSVKHARKLIERALEMA